MEFASIIIATASAIISIVTFFVTVGFEKRKITIRAINLLQNEVLDKFVFVKKDNVKFVVENLEDEKCRKTYDEYRTLVARLEHFAVGVNKRIYNYGIVKVLLGNHLIFLCFHTKCPISGEGMCSI